MWVDFDVRGQQEMDFFTGGSSIMVFDQKRNFNVKMHCDGFVSYEHTAFHLTRH